MKKTIEIAGRTFTIQLKFGCYEGELCWEATTVDYPDLAEYADSHDEAIELIVSAIETTLALRPPNS